MQTGAILFFLRFLLFSKYPPPQKKLFCLLCCFSAVARIFANTAGTDWLSSRREVLTARFFKRQVLPYLLLCRQNNETVNKLRNAKPFETSRGRTNHFKNSFWPYSLSRFTETMSLHLCPCILYFT